jgi:hypothetical protein
VRRGDIQALAESFPNIQIAIVDGVFHQQPAVGHAEIRDAIRDGARIWGLSSIGAIRAAEMAHLGMKGFGEVYADFSADPGMSDDEVALLHAPQSPYLAVSEPMVHWRRYLEALRLQGFLTDAAKFEIVEDLIDRWYGERTLELGAELLYKIGGIHLDYEELDSALAPYRVKQLDLVRFLQSRPWGWERPNRHARTVAAPSTSSDGKSALDLVSVGGLPFIDIKFDASRFLSAVSGVRAALLRNRNVSCCDGDGLLQPEVAVKAFTLASSETTNLPPHRALTEQEKAWAELARKRARAASARLACMFDLPLQLLRWQSSKVSMTNPYIPQTVFLGDGAFQSSCGMLEEVWVHEVAHVWLGLLCEMRDFQTRGSGAIYTLPSGTGPKDARGVLFAAHFAGAVAAWLGDAAAQTPLFGYRAERFQYAVWYLHQALEIDIDEDLTPMGRAVHAKLLHYGSSVTKR